MARKRKNIRRSSVGDNLNQGAKIKRFIGSLLVAFILLGVLMFSGWHAYPQLWVWLGSQEMFRVKTVVVEGIESLAEDQIEKTLPDIRGTNLFKIDLEEIRSAVRKEPWVESVALHRRLPDELVIQIKERTPIALINGGTLWAVDRLGVLLPLETWRGVLDLPLVDCRIPDNVKPGATLDDDRIQQALEYLDRIRWRLPELWQLISEISWDENHQLTFYASATRTRILVGRDPCWEQMLNFYSFMIYEGGRAGMDDISSVDLRFPGQVVIKRNNG